MELKRFKNKYSIFWDCIFLRSSLNCYLIGRENDENDMDSLSPHHPRPVWRWWWRLIMSEQLTADRVRNWSSVLTMTTTAGAGAGPGPGPGGLGITNSRRRRSFDKSCMQSTVRTPEMWRINIQAGGEGECDGDKKALAWISHPNQQSERNPLIPQKKKRGFCISASKLKNSF